MGMPPARWLRIAALARRLPPPPVPAINRAIYSELARMGALADDRKHSEEEYSKYNFYELTGKILDMEEPAFL